jgi:hypothetical protein
MQAPMAKFNFCGKDFKLDGESFQKHIEMCKLNPNASNQEEIRINQHDLKDAFAMSDDEDLDQLLLVYYG